MNNLEYSIEVANLTKKFGQYTSVDNVSFKVRQGEIFGFLGANGAGKSTTIKMLCGILQPSSGNAFINGFSIISQTELVKKSIGYMSQKFSLYDDLTIEENINFFARVYGLEGTILTERKKWVLETANLMGKESFLTKDLPGGIKQRLALANAVIHQPKIIFLDEPTSGVDPISRRAFWELINQLSTQGITIFVTTHYLEEAEFCNNIILINAGKLIAEGNPTFLKEKYIKYPIFEIEANPLNAAIAFLNELSYIEEVSAFGNYIHILTNSNFKSLEVLQNDLTNKSNFKLERIEKITPTLEDVFIHLLEQDPVK